MGQHALLKKLRHEMEEFYLLLISGQFFALQIRPLLLNKIREGQEFNKKLSEIKYEVEKERTEYFQIKRDGIPKVNKKLLNE